MTDERAWLDMGRAWLQQDEMAGVGVTPDDLDAVADDAPDDPEPAEVVYYELGERRVLPLDGEMVELPF
jgi:hypothetical protein